MQQFASACLLYNYETLRVILYKVRDSKPGRRSGSRNACEIEATDPSADSTANCAINRDRLARLRSRFHPTATTAIPFHEAAAANGGRQARGDSERRRSLHIGPWMPDHSIGNFVTTLLSGGEVSADFTTTRRGRPRSEKARDAILHASIELLLERGVAATTVDAVAVAAGVSKATIYRWWPTKETLAMDALYQEWAAMSPAVDTGSVRADLRTLLCPWAELAARRPYDRIIAGLLVEVVSDPDFALEYRARFLEHRREQGRLILQRAIRHGEIPADTPLEIVLDMLYGPVYHRLLHGHAPIDAAFVRQVIDIVLDGIEFSPPDRGIATS
ncbi:TetR-like C-terminal domain-containing protein [Nocardia sp. NPDC049190]|uniref:TetR-like C-terminal domain-containing protein n=1 Tax=Nocardia sp. NPDC049190 TaxID=3155650 RepID=UPI0033F8B5ED